MMAGARAADLAAATAAVPLGTGSAGSDTAYWPFGPLRDWSGPGCHLGTLLPGDGLSGLTRLASLATEVAVLCTANAVAAMLHHCCCCNAASLLQHCSSSSNAAAAKISETIFGSGQVKVVRVWLGRTQSNYMGHWGSWGWLQGNSKDLGLLLHIYYYCMHVCARPGPCSFSCLPCFHVTWRTT